MRCTSYCTASSYDIPRLYQDVQKQGISQLYRNLIHMQTKEEKRTKGDIFYFSYGAVVFWGYTEEEEHAVLDPVCAALVELRHMGGRGAFREPLQIHQRRQIGVHAGRAQQQKYMEDSRHRYCLFRPTMAAARMPIATRQPMPRDGSMDR